MSLVIETQTAGDDFTLQGDVGPGDFGEGVVPTDPLIKAWITIKTGLAVPDAQASLQKTITTTQVVGVGHIVQDGGPTTGNGTATLRFDFTAADTAALGYGTRYVYDIQVKTSSGKISTVPDQDTGETIGRLQLKRGATDATT